MLDLQTERKTMMSNLTPISDERVLAALRKQQERALDALDLVEMRRLVVIYRGLGFVSNAAALEKRVEHYESGRAVVL
jgi:hypothetical protein